MKNKHLILTLATLLTISGCMTISYTPKVSLDISPNTIKKSIKVENLVDKTTKKQKKKPAFGFSATNSESLTGELSTEVTNAIIADFNMNGVFSKISKRVDNPDLLLKGEITKFEAKYRLTKGGWFTLPVDLVWFFGIPIMKNEVDIEIQISIYKKTGELVGEYKANTYDKKLHTIYNNGAFALPAKTNKIFSNVIQKIRDAKKLN